MSDVEFVDYLSLNETRTYLNSIHNTRDRAIVSLILSTGLFLKEVISLEVDHVNWADKTITIINPDLTNRERTLQLNGDACEAISKWTHDRSKTPIPNLFITTKGKPGPLSERSIDHIIRKYANNKDITRNINSNLLRNTFAVRYLNDTTDIKTASQVLGIKDSQSLKRYLATAKHYRNANPTETPEKTDTRDGITKLIHTTFPTTPKRLTSENKTEHISGTIDPKPQEIIVGREKIIETLLKNIGNQTPIVLTGNLGLGKTHILKHLHHRLPVTSMYIATPTPIKQLLTDVCTKLNPTYKQSVGSRPNVRDLITHLKTIPIPNETVLLIDNLHKLRPADAEIFLSLMKRITLIGATETTVPKLKAVWWKFNNIPLEPLSETDSKMLLKYLTQNLTIKHYDMLEQTVLNESGGYPVSIVDMATQLRSDTTITHHTIRELKHSAGKTYRDWSSGIIVLWGLIVASRFMALGMHSVEGYILTGIGASFMIVMRYAVAKAR